MDQPRFTSQTPLGPNPDEIQVSPDEHFWFDPDSHQTQGYLSGREKYIGVALAGIMTAFAALGFFSTSGNPSGGITLASFILFVTGLGIGFFMLREKTPKPNIDPQMMAAALSNTEEAAALSDAQGRLLSANAKYRQFFEGRAPSISKLLFDKHYGDFIRELMAAALVGQSKTIKIRSPKGQRNIFITAKPDGPFILWCFVARDPGLGPLSTIGNIENYFQALLDQFSLGLLIRDSESKIRYANPKATELLDVDLAKIRGKDAGKVFTPAVLRKNKVNIDWLKIPEAGGKKAPFHFGVVQKLGSVKGAGAEATVDDFEKFVSDAPIAIAMIDTLDFRIEEMNPAFKEIFSKHIGVQLKPGDNLLKSLPEDVGELLEKKHKETGNGEAVGKPVEFSFDPNNEEVIQAFFGTLKGTGKGRFSILYLIDTSETKRLEMQFVQAQKMQAVGQLAGGVAHDFNNLLTAIIGFCDLLLIRHKPGDQSFADLIQIKQNANRAADLIRQLLAFSRRQTLHPKVLDVTEVLSDLSNLIRRLIGEQIKLKMNHGKDLGYIRADQGQVEQVIINMAVNARDAMPKGGTLTIKTEAILAEDVPKLNHAQLEVRDYVRIKISDTGVGISRENLDKVFEPFFTTKDVGKGTGLGLSTAYGIINQTGGNVFVTSKEGKGASFDIFLPALGEEEVVKTVKKVEREGGSKDLTGTEVILFVEDEDPVRTFVSRALQNKGYKVLEADSGEAAMEVLEKYSGNLDLLISDVVMPSMDGPTLARKVIETYPDIKIILISGYAEAGFDKGLERERFSFIPKPFSLQTLAEKVRSVLEDEAQ